MQKKLHALISKFNELRLSKAELRFISARQKKIVPNTTSTILIQTPIDYYYLCHFDLILSAEFPSHRVLGLWPYNIHQQPRRINTLIRTIQKPLRFIVNQIRKKKWKKLYQAIGVRQIYKLDDIGFIKSLQYSKRAKKIAQKLKTKEDVLRLEIDGVIVGDLIYDTYLRFRCEPTIDLADSFLELIIFKTIIGIENMRTLFAKENITVLLTSYSTYTHHGIAARVAIEQKVKVYSDGNLSQYWKELTQQDWRHKPEHYMYLEKFNSLSNQEACIRQSQTLLRKRFYGEIDSMSTYMKKSAYSNSKSFTLPNHIKGVVFLHDFFDSPHIYRSLLFCDFYEWALFTLNIIKKYKLPIAIKPHPNQLVESIELVKQLQGEFADLCWLDSDVSNNDIFPCIDFGVSCYGTVLYELAYHGKISIAAGDHPSVDFNFTKTAGSIEEYESLLKDTQNLKPPVDKKDAVLAFFYMYSLYVDDALQTPARDMQLKNIDFSAPESLDVYLELIKAYDNIAIKKN